jgi:2-polyprenyl-3-methyl-5-hydroxy-6-metoxy-1,4-benzoquinol methylase
MKVLKKSQDAQGRAMLDYLIGKKAQEIIERDDGYIDVDYGPKTYFSKYKDWPAHQKQAMKYVRGRVLDIGCGAGRHSLYLQNKGYEVLGIDVSPYAIQVCRKRGLKNVKLLPVTQANRKLGKFDTILMLGNNFGLFENLKHGRNLLKMFSAITNSMARIIAETLDPYGTKEPYHTQYHKQNRLKGKFGGEVKIRVRYQNLITPWFNYWLASKSEVLKMLKGTNWHLKKFIDSKGPIYIAVIEKKN